MLTALVALTLTPALALHLELAGDAVDGHVIPAIGERVVCFRQQYREYPPQEYEVMLAQRDGAGITEAIAFPGDPHPACGELQGIAVPDDAEGDWAVHAIHPLDNTRTPRPVSPTFRVCDDCEDPVARQLRWHAANIDGGRVIDTAGTVLVPKGKLKQLCYTHLPGIVGTKCVAVGKRKGGVHTPAEPVFTRYIAPDAPPAPLSPPSDWATRTEAKPPPPPSIHDDTDEPVASGPSLPSGSWVEVSEPSSWAFDGCSALLVETFTGDGLLLRRHHPVRDYTRTLPIAGRWMRLTGCERGATAQPVAPASASKSKSKAPPSPSGPVVVVSPGAAQKGAPVVGGGVTLIDGDGWVTFEGPPIPTTFRADSGELVIGDRSSWRLGRLRFTPVGATSIYVRGVRTLTIRSQPYGRGELKVVKAAAAPGQAAPLVGYDAVVVEGLDSGGFVRAEASRRVWVSGTRPVLTWSSAGWLAGESTMSQDGYDDWTGAQFFGGEDPVTVWIPPGPPAAVRVEAGSSIFWPPQQTVAGGATVSASTYLPIPADLATQTLTFAPETAGLCGVQSITASLRDVDVDVAGADEREDGRWPCKPGDSYVLTVTVAPGELPPEAPPGDLVTLFLYVNEPPESDERYVRLARHTAMQVDAEHTADNWVPEMDAFVGRIARIVASPGDDMTGTAVVRVDVDGGRFLWRPRKRLCVVEDGEIEHEGKRLGPCR